MLEPEVELPTGSSSSKQEQRSKAHFDGCQRRSVIGKNEFNMEINFARHC